MTVEELISFEKDIADCFNSAQIKAPIHLSGGNEQRLIDIFKNIRQNDWVCTTWRSHYHILLKGVPPNELKRDILLGKSITLNYPHYRILSSAIVGGILPIALGIAFAIARQKLDEVVWCFVGDMTAYTGAFYECLQYANGFDLPVRWIVEDNGKSVCTDTASVWGGPSLAQQFFLQRGQRVGYSYVLPWPHAGAGKRVNF